MIPEIVAAISGSKNAFDLAKGILTMTTDYAVINKTHDLIAKIQLLSDQLFEIKIRVAEMHDEKREILKKLGEFEQWDKNIAPYYGIIALAENVLVYAPANTDEARIATGNTPHYLCSRCFHERRKALLQRQGHEIGGMVYKCEVCGNTVCNHADKPPSWIGAVKTKSRRNITDGY